MKTSAKHFHLAVGP